MTSEGRDPERSRGPVVRVVGSRFSAILFCVFVVLLMINFMSEQAGRGPEPVTAQGKCSGGLVERFGCYVDGLANNVAAFDPSSVKRRFDSQLAHCRYGWDFACEPIPIPCVPITPLRRVDVFHAVDCETRAESARALCRQDGASGLGMCRDLALGIYIPDGCADWSEYKRRSASYDEELKRQQVTCLRRAWTGYSNILESVRGVPSASFHTVVATVQQGQWPALVALLATLLATWAILLRFTRGNPFSAAALAFIVGPFLVSANAWLISHVMRWMMGLISGAVSLLLFALWVAKLVDVFVAAAEVARAPKELRQMLKK